MSREEFIQELNMSNGKDNHANRAYERVIHEYDRLKAENTELREQYDKVMRDVGHLLTDEYHEEAIAVLRRKFQKWMSQSQGNNE